MARRKNNIIIVPETTKAGVYAIINKNLHKCYIGQSDNARSRLKSHLCSLEKGKHHCKSLQKDYDNNHRFKMIVLKEFEGRQTKDKRKCFEDYYIICMRLNNIDLYNSEKAGNTIDSFFQRIKFLDKTVRNLKDEIMKN